MKKSNLILLLASLSLLTSCGESSSSNDQPSTTNDPTLPTTVDPSTVEPSTTTDDPSSDSSSTSEVTYSKYTTPGDFADGFNAGEQFYESSDGPAKLKAALDPNGKIIQSLSLSSITVQEIDTEDGQKSKELTLGTGSSDGELIIKTLSPLVAISFELQSYAKYIAYSSSYSRDVASNVTVNGVTKSLTVNETGANPIETFEVEFSEPTSEIKINNDEAKHRAFIKSITFTY